MVIVRGAALRGLSRERLLGEGRGPIEPVVVRGRSATIGIIVQSRADGSLRVVVQGFMPGRLLPFIKSVALDGFYKHPDGSVGAMPDEELYEFG